MVDPKFPIYEELKGLGFVRFGLVQGKCLRIDTKPKPEPVVYVAVLERRVFWVGETGNARQRFSAYRRWLALPDDSSRSDVRVRNRLLDMIGGRPLVMFLKPPMTIWSGLTAKEYPGHRVEEAILIDYFQPAWNLRRGGRSKG